MTNRTDNFNRAGPAILGSTPSDSGGTWAGNGTWTIFSNTATKSATPATSEVAYLESSVADVDVVATMTATGNAGLVARLSDTSNYIYARCADFNVIIYKVVAGTFTQLGSTYSGITAVSDVWTLSVSGNDLILKQNGTARVTTSDAHNNTATKHGFGAFGIDSGWDDFSISETGGGFAQLPGRRVKQAVNRASTY